MAIATQRHHIAIHIADPKNTLFTTRRGLTHSSTVPFTTLKIALAMNKYSPMA